MMRLLVSTTNPGKKKEFLALFRGSPFDLVFPEELGVHVEVEETGSTYAENAILKARTFSEITGLATLADDTGLEVGVLGGRPGLYSARFSPLQGATDGDRRLKLLDELREKPQPWTARFFCAVALFGLKGSVQVFDGEIKGEIISRERGELGFGYDRIFWIPVLQKTMAELTLVEKNLYSHRAIAVKKALVVLQQIENEGS
ncbi:MAG: RdgB/HAM1 family non-canonical purine NTP pyrophosphatase [Chloroflexi bacterium]|nr:RdgB/HAM1 family non-canonical purine NTP pyrophosphatase [Chloroflexota bacterium]